MSAKEVIEQYQQLHDLLSEAIENPETNRLIGAALGKDYKKAVKILEKVGNYKAPKGSFGY